VFDCIGLVLRSYAQAGVLGKLGGWYNDNGYTLLRWARARHLVSSTHGQPGDVVVWGGGGHVGIYLGNGMAISALTSGVRVHGIHAVTKRFTAFIHTGLTGLQARAVATAHRVHMKAIMVRHAKAPAALWTSHYLTASVALTFHAGTKLTVFRVWKDAAGRTWYFVNGNHHVGWVLAAKTRA
jgi:cell wall-associated NlpC family hydrolase